MAKKTKVEAHYTIGADGAQELVAAVAPAKQNGAVQYEIGKLPRAELTGSRYGAKGNQGTYAAICAALRANGPMDVAGITAVAAGLNHKRFVRYAIRSHWLLPVQEKLVQK